MKIDEEGIHTLTKYSTRKGKKSIKPSDHNPLILHLYPALNVRKNEEPTRKEIFNFSNTPGSPSPHFNDWNSDKVFLEWKTSKDRK